MPYKIAPRKKKGGGGGERETGRSSGKFFGTPDFRLGKVEHLALCSESPPRRLRNAIVDHNQMHGFVTWLSSLSSISIDKASTNCFRQITRLLLLPQSIDPLVPFFHDYLFTKSFQCLHEDDSRANPEYASPYFIF